MARASLAEEGRHLTRERLTAALLVRMGALRSGYLAPSAQTKKMALRDRLNDEMKDAMRAGDKVRLGAIRMLSAALLEREKDGRGVAITEADETAIVQKQAKQRRDSITQFRDNGRDDLAVKEEAELAIIEAYLPAQLSDEEIAGVVAGIMAGVDATGPQAMGRVMGEAMKALKGQADGARVRAAVEQALKG